MSATWPASEGHRQGILQIGFTQLWRARGAPHDAIMYSTKFTPEIQCFFSPGAVAIARPLLISFGAVECSKPDLSELRVLVNISGRA